MFLSLNLYLHLSKIKYYLNEDYSAKIVFDDTHPVIEQFHRGFLRMIYQMFKINLSYFAFMFAL